VHAWVGLGDGALPEGRLDGCAHGGDPAHRCADSHAAAQPKHPRHHRHL